MAKKENNVADKTSKKVIFWLSFVSFIFFFPFIGIFINEITSAYFCNIYTLGLDRKDFFNVWIALFGAIGIAINIYQNHRRTTNQDIQLVNQNIQLEKQDKQLEKQAEQIQLQGTQLELQSKSQRDSRFSKGVELLGNANESARTGAAYSLFFLAKDYPEEFAKPVFEILCSHIRNITTTEEYKKKNNERPSNEIQSILDLLFKNDESRPIFDGLKANLAYSYLYGADLSEADLSEANLSSANLLKVILLNANLYRADLSEAYLSEAYLFGANASEANLSGTDSSKSFLNGANLSRANFLGSIPLELSPLKANLSRAYLMNTDLSGANLSGADLSGVIIDNTTFSVETILDGVDISQIGLNKIKGKINPKYLPNPENKTNADSQ